ncbi:hypothetical protein [Haloarchaeobius sp. HME9146]|uniref:hypothetical protein n=1 Tax=Haloarchaeobius sp. HME9146 TaxID=2978732 RepID=UPI0021BF53F7|nr:hypothetical protein [Haloarchaeobius sp. HME9146]MCT9098513.1 hypothetical protein [Haloarchaeobius sp. HME9146]
MTGMKKGAGEDPFADDPDPVDQVAEDDESTATSTDTPGQPADEPSTTIPYRFRRTSVQDGRDRVPLFLQPETKTAEDDALAALEDAFESNVSRTDLREALVTVGLQHLDEVEGQLEDWGYGMRFDE